MRSSGNSRVYMLVLTLFLAAGIHGSVHARQQANATAAMVVVTGTADVGGQFAGTFVLARFEPQNANDGIVAVGSIHGGLNGRNIVTQVAIPITLASPIALTSGNDLQTAGLTAAAPNSCDAVRVELAPSSFRVLGSVVTLDAASFDIISSAEESASVVTGVSPTAPTGSTTSGIGSTATFPTVFPTTQPRTSAPAATVGSLTPGVVAPVPQTTNAVAAPTRQQLGRLLCSVSAQLQSTSSSAQIVPLLNQVLAALRQ